MAEIELKINDIERRLENIENMLLHGNTSPLIKLRARSIRTSDLSSITADMGTLTAGTIQTGTTAPYVTIDSDGILILNTLTGTAALRLETDGPDTVTEMRECEGGLAVSSDQADVVSFRLYDTEYQAGGANLRLQVECTAAQTFLRGYDASDTASFEIVNTFASGDTEINGLDAGDLKLSSASGQVVFADDIEPAVDASLYLGDYEKGFAGLVLADDSDGKWYAITSHNGAVTITEVTS